MSEVKELIDKSIVKKRVSRKKKGIVDRSKYKIDESIKGDVESIFTSLLGYKTPYTLTQVRHMRLAKYLNHKGYTPMEAVMVSGAMVMEAMYDIKYKQLKTDNII